MSTLIYNSFRRCGTIANIIYTRWLCTHILKVQRSRLPPDYHQQDGRIYTESQRPTIINAANTRLESSL